MSNDNPTTPTAPGRKLWQFRLRDLALVMALVAVWSSVAINRRAIDTLNARLARNRPLARVLEVDDPTKFAAIQRDPRWFDENTWEVHVPEGRYHVCLATRSIGDTGLAPASKSTPISSGRRTITLEQGTYTERNRVTISLDGTPRFQVEESSDWDPGHGSMGGGLLSSSTAFSPSGPVVLFRRRFTRPDGTNMFRAPREPCEGLLLWIEPEPAP